MTRPRNQLIDRENGGFYHIVSRCVRRAWLSGCDPVSGNDYSYRRDWIERLMLALTNFFTVEVLAYAVMSNHYHIVINYRPKDSKRLSAKQIARRWLAVFPPKPDADVDELVATMIRDTSRIKELRARLGDLSWYMRCLNAPIARRSNIEDNCTGRFWDGRYLSKPLPNERAVLACMAYSDLNPLRAGDTNRVDAPTHTALRRRLEEAADKPEKLEQAMAPLTFDVSRGCIESTGKSALTLTLQKYRAHVEWAAARVNQAHKPNDADQRNLSPDLTEPHAWLKYFSKLRRRTLPHASLPRGMLAFTN